MRDVRGPTFVPRPVVRGTGARLHFALMRSKRLLWLAATCAALVLLLLLAWPKGEAPARVPPPPPPAAQAQRAAPPPATPPPAVTAAAPAAPAAAADAPPLGTGYTVDLQRLRAQLPDNLYWREAAPTEDPELLKAREEAAARRNTLFGRVQANEASEDEIHAHFAYRRQLSEDYIALSQQVLENGGSALSEGEVSLHQLNIQLHRARLEELPAQEADALERHARHEERRQAWLRAGGGR